ncbi:MAG: protein translocase subunit SecD [Erysipelotrichaceae bacterium]|nr:protein translocase subunit SecD [Erysipelotrichaceae bacterium]
MNTKTNNKRLAVFFVTVACIAALIISCYKGIAGNLSLGLDLQGGFEILYEVTPLDGNSTITDMSAVATSIQKRVDVLGVSEPEIIIEGDNRVRVQLAGVSDQAQARSLLGATANLTFRDINDNLLGDASIIEEGQASLGYENGMPVVSLKIKDKKAFGDMTESVSKMGSGSNIMVIWLDYEEGDSYVEETAKANAGQEPKYISAASVQERIDGDCIIKGSFDETRARELASLINSGSLPVKMAEISSNVVSAEFGMDAFNKTATAGIAGVALVILFMIVMYRLPGIVASIMLAVYLFVVFGIYSLMGVTFTLPGIAALVLGVGMTVDANIITFERTKDELYMGRPIQKAVEEGQKLSFSTIFDAQFTTLLAAVIMYVFGNGAVRGFATMLMITTLCTLALNVAVSRFLMNQLVKSGICDDKYGWFGVKKEQVPNLANNEEQFYFGPIKKMDFMKDAPKFSLVSGAILALAIVLAIVNMASGKGMVNLGIDFASGTKLTVSAPETINVDDVDAVFNDLGYGNKFSYQVSGDKTVYATTTASLTTEELSAIKEAFVEEYGIEPGDNVVTPTVGADLVKNAIVLTLLAWVVMLIYITIRFKWDFAVACIVALLHDVFIVLSVFAIFRFEVNTELISVILAIIGYSINNSIVVFDRVRELLAGKKNVKNEELAGIVNSALDNTIVRSLYSSITTILPIIALLALGSQAIFTFNFAMFVGLIAGTFSSIYIAPYTWLYIRTHTKPKAAKPKKVYKEELDEISITGINA